MNFGTNISTTSILIIWPKYINMTSVGLVKNKAQQKKTNTLHKTRIKPISIHFFSREKKKEKQKKKIEIQEKKK